jgi:SAM-dependent methyltransferase
MRFNTCCTARSFESPAWRQVYDEFHRGLRLPETPDRGRPLPSMFDWYRQTLWHDDPARIGRVWCAPDNVRQTHKIWEYVQVLACLYHSLGDPRGKRVLSLGAGVESPLWTLARWGAEVTATDIYFERRYWHPEQVEAIRRDPSVFSPYEETHPVAFRNLNLRLNSLGSLLAWSRLGTFDAIYSISSLEHVHGVQRRTATRLHRRTLARKLGLFRRIARRLEPGGVLAFTTELITDFSAERRLDFYTREELEVILGALAEEGLAPVDEVAWDTMGEQQLATRDTPGQHHTAIALALRKSAG